VLAADKSIHERCCFRQLTLAFPIPTHSGSVAASFLPLLEGSYDVTSVVRFATVNRWPQSGRFIIAVSMDTRLQAEFVSVEPRAHISLGVCRMLVCSRRSRSKTKHLRILIGT
jgi:hypothetical protein